MWRVARVSSQDSRGSEGQQSGESGVKWDCVGAVIWASRSACGLEHLYIRWSSRGVDHCDLSSVQIFGWGVDMLTFRVYEKTDWRAVERAGVEFYRVGG